MPPLKIAALKAFGAALSNVEANRLC